MGQPFISGKREQLYQSASLREVRLMLKEDHILIEWDRAMTAVSSGLWGGGWHDGVRRIVNWRVPLDFACADPIALMEQQLRAWGYGSEQVIGLQTAADLHAASVIEETGDCFRLLCCTTAGIGNAARAGRPRQTYSAYSCGTINTALMVKGRLTPAAMINALLTATEAKAVALQDLGIRDENGEIASGTTTDSIALVVSQQGYEETHQFAGTATSIGHAIARSVYQSVVEAIGE
ncbi:hypothetical protein BEP19_03660 [Ammoniphilus oxalaticus]|uniref:Adenosylcobinamide amidohydrolase n=1 Tax=Ammoniphilus oxalaticus TaxID=66863 RepID=A0A419SLU6_9BACL|nr:adenosylcobinamide amidohydrolase [Ammoniphilus oxalaticus]RKD24944.1 hypothetical protein BEP19_03660 [Ammoniphilus oxalaticus]